MFWCYFSLIRTVSVKRFLTRTFVLFVCCVARLMLLVYCCCFEHSQLISYGYSRCRMKPKRCTRIYFRWIVKREMLYVSRFFFLVLYCCFDVVFSLFYHITAANKTKCICNSIYTWWNVRCRRKRWIKSMQRAILSVVLVLLCVTLYTRRRRPYR